MSDVPQQSAADQIMRHILNRITAADSKRRETIHAEIRQRGTWWAADEIDRLRRQVQSLRCNTSQPGRDHDD